VEEGIARPVLIARPERIRELAEELSLPEEGLEIYDFMADEETMARYAAEYHDGRQRRGVTGAEARRRMRNSVYVAAMMVREGRADGLVAGQDMHYPETIRPCLEILGTAEGVRHVAGLYMMVLENRLLFFADTTVNIDPDAETLAEIAVLSARFVRRLGMMPRVAMVSFSNFGSNNHPLATRVRKATALARELAPELAIDGEMQADTALVPGILERDFPFHRLGGPANVLVFPNLDAANAAFKLMARAGRAEAFGPILLGMAASAHVLQRGSEAADIANLTAIAVVDAQERDAEAAG
jgi:malate dehydrogenase (oxaloacetate-decarboxylating)(NADP+)